MTRLLSLVFFIAGLVVPAWVAAGYVGSNPLALAMTALIVVVYLVGALELYRYQQATVALSGALSGLTGPVQQLDEWLARLPVALRDSVRVRVKGERVALPGPSLAPYLAGLLVLLGMLGTFLGMVATLRGTGLALESATDLQAIRASLAAPVQGLGLAFGTSVAGVATSAMLGLLSTLCRRERQQSARLLDAQIANHLYEHTQAYQREVSLTLLQSQAEVMPVVVERLQALATALEQRSDVLATSLEKRSETLALSIEKDSNALAAALERRSEVLAGVLEQSSQSVVTALETRSQSLLSALDERSQQSNEKLHAAQEAFHAKTAAAYAQLASSVEQSLKDGIAEGARSAGAAIEPIAQSTLQALAHETTTMRDAIAQAVDQQMQALSRQAQDSAEGVSQTWRQALDEQRLAAKSLADDMRASLGGFSQTLEQRSAAVLDGVTARLEQVSQALSQTWEGAAQRQEQANQQLSVDNQAAMAQAAQAWEQQAAALVVQLHEAQSQMRGQLLGQDEKRLAAWTETLAQMAAGLQQAWQQASAESLSTQQQICKTLEAAAAAVASESREQAQGTLAQLQQLALAVADAPKAAAEAVAEVRQKLSDSMARDNAMLEERGRLLETLSTLLDAVNHASSEQRKAVDELVATSAEVLQRVGTQFTEQAQAEAGKLTGVAEQVVDGAAQITGLGEAFGKSVQAFGESNEALMAQLQRIEQALDKSLARSDDQLAYYVAQAREVVDLSMLSQKQIIEELRQVGAARSGSEAPAA